MQGGQEPSKTAILAGEWPQPGPWALECKEHHRLAPTWARGPPWRRVLAEGHAQEKGQLSASAVITAAGEQEHLGI